MIDSFAFNLQTRVRYGVDEALKLPQHLQDLGYQRIGILVDRAVAASSAWQAVEQSLGGVNVIVRQETDVTEPTYDQLDEARLPFMDRDLDGLVVAGGGSVLDMGKAISVLISNRGPALSYRGFNLVTEPGPGVIAIPTTAGTGSEVTPNAVFIDTNEGRKFGINTDLYLPKLAILDPRLTASCPKGPTVSAGMDALVHSHESFVSKKANPVTRSLATQGFRLVFHNLARAAEHPDDLEARGAVLLGAYLAASALFNSSAGPSGAMSYPLGVLCGVPHGLAGAVFLPYIVEHNVAGGYQGYAELPEALQLRELADRLGVPHQLDGFGFTRQHIDAFLTQCKFLAAAFDMNPVSFQEPEIRALLERMTPA